MIGLITLKRALKTAAGWTAVLEERLAGPRPQPAACILFYHRVAAIGFRDPHSDDWNVPPSSFARQVAALAEFAEVVPLEEVPGRLARPQEAGRPLVCLTFDDGYANFYTEALPVLERFHVPATVFVITSLIGRREPPPFDNWSLRNKDRAAPDAWRPMNWEELEACLSTGLVTVGAHSHRHLKGVECTPPQLTEEAERSRAILQSRLGSAQANAYSYPYGSTRLGYVTEAYVNAVRRAGYELAVTTDLGLAGPGCEPHLLPRVEAHAHDGAGVLRAKARGALSPYFFTDRLRRAKRAA